MVGRSRLAVIAVVVVAAPSSAAFAQVGSAGAPLLGCKFASIAAAVAAVPAGATLVLAEGAVYTENVVLTKDVKIIVGDPNCRNQTFANPAILRPRPGLGRPMTVGPGLDVELWTLVIERGNVPGLGGNLYVDAGADVALVGVTIREGGAASGGGIYSNGGNIEVGAGTEISSNSAVDGGGIYAVGGTLTLLPGIEIHHNTAAQDGGAVYADEDVSVVTDGAIIHSNVASGSGGGIWARSSTFDIGPLTEIKLNEAGDDGGGISLISGTTEIDATAFLGLNSAGGFGGALCAALASVLDLDGLYWSNTAATGGAVYLRDATLPHLSGTYADNVASAYGGAIALDATGSGRSATFGNIQLLSNSAGHGGGFALIGPIEVHVTGFEVAGNTATLSGGGIYVSKGELYSATSPNLTGNSAADGGALAVACADDVTVRIGPGIMTDNVATNRGGAVAVSNGTSASCSVFLRDYAIDRNLAGGAGGGVATWGNTTVTLSEDELRENEAGTDGGGLAALDDGGPWRPTIILQSPPTSGEPCLHGSTALAKNEYCSEIRDNAAQRGGGVFIEEGVGTMDKTAFIGNDAAVRGAAISIGPSSQVRIRASNLLLVSHAVLSLTPPEVVYLGSGATFELWTSTMADNDGAALVWDAGSTGALYMNAIATHPIVIDPSIASLPGDCNAIAEATPQLAGANDIGMDNTQFVSLLRSAYEVDAASTLLFRKCARMPGMPDSDIDNVPRTSLYERGAFDEDKW